ncbi:RBBP9/YdeN family alpha/beta hydrolase [Aquabacterium sp. J223]|uniref:RBBP9/YdeN family alpha/beta hydrolase n=1 Tax=Aquabacterium sp. J223 TaxID=2898431 RepID=UPI0021ADB810|nr:alpha/beta hydrolase [Aquabacterium sp. J223]
MARPAGTSHAPRLLIVPGLHDSGPEHWQSWLQRLVPGSVRVVQDDWARPDLEGWSARIAQTLERAGPAPWIAAAHSFGCLALAHHVATRPGSPLRAVLLVAPADPARFGVEAALPQRALGPHATVVASRTDPWMSADRALHWGRLWGAHCLDLGDAGHINTEAGFGPLPLARRWVLAMGRRLARDQRPARRTVAEWSFAV